MQIKSIDIQNYCGIEKLNLEFQQGINLLIGNNGAGKTSLLTALAITISEPLSLITVKKGAIASVGIGENAYTTTSLVGDTVVQTISHYPVTIKSNINVDNTDYIFQTTKKSISTIEQQSGYELHVFFRDSIGNPQIAMPLLCFLRAGRGKAVKGKTTTVTLAIGEVERSQGYRGAFTGELNMEEIQNWCIQMDFAAYQQKREITEYKAFQEIVSRFISLMDEKAVNPKLYYSSSAGSIVYFDGTTEQPLYQLSAGYQAVLCMAIELAYRAVILNPVMDDIASKTEGVVLIDEIEMHLHPAWQWKILNALKNTFPKVQFIIATHSPIILSSANGAALYLMKSPNDVHLIDNVYGYNISDILTLPQGTYDLPKEISTYYDDAEIILDRGTEAQLDELLSKAEKELADSPEVLKAFIDFVEINRWVEDA